MTDGIHDRQAPAGQEVGHDDEAGDLAGLPAHPKGTLAIVLIYGALFALGWAWVYVGEFLARGAPTP